MRPRFFPGERGDATAALQGVSPDGIVQNGGALGSAGARHGGQAASARTAFNGLNTGDRNKVIALTRAHAGDVMVENRGRGPGLIFWTGARCARADLK